MARRLEVEVESELCAFVRGYGSRDLLTELRGRPPIWSTRSRAWVTTARTARDVVAVAESRGWDVVVTGVNPVPASGGTPGTTSPGEHPDPGRGLW